MSRDRLPFVAQGTWRSGALHIWGWDGDSPASTAWLYGGVGPSRWGDRHVHHEADDEITNRGWRDSPIRYGSLSRFHLDLPHGGKRSVPVVVLDPVAATTWLGEIGNPLRLSPSLAWFAEITKFAAGLVWAERVTPVIVEEGPFTVARWMPVLDQAQSDSLAHAASIAPAICRNGSGASTLDIVSTIVDAITRSSLHQAGWRPDLGRHRSAQVQATRSVFASLAKHDPVIRTGANGFHDAIAELSNSLDRHRRRLEGETVIRSRVRLTLPTDAADPWLVQLDLTDDNDAGRWCTAEDVWTSAPRAIDLAGGEHKLANLGEEITALVALTVPHIPFFSQLTHTQRPTGVELDLEQAAEFIDVAPAELSALGIELIGPEHLVKAKVGVRGTATESVGDDRKSRFNKEALVEWGAVIDGTPISDAELARVEAAGSTLMRAGHRWVRIDPAGLRRARKLLSDQVAHHSSIGAIDVLRIASGEQSDGEVPITLVAADESIDDTAAWGWIRSLINGLPDELLEEAHESDLFRGELRHYQRRGLAWLRFLAGLGVGGCLADDMGLGKTATALAHLVERPGPHLVVCPLSVVHNWEAETRRFTPSLSTVVHHGPSRNVGDPALFNLSDNDVVITTYGLLPRDLEALSAIEWNTVVLDEAQVIKNAGTRAAKAVRKLRSGQKLALTGTPVENRLSELWAILDAVNPGMLGSQQRFRERYGTAIERHNDLEVAARLRKLTQPFVLRRMKSDRRLVPELPEKIEQIAFAKLTREQAILYQKVVDQLLVDAKHLEGMQRRGRVLAAITRLKQICNHPAHALKDGSRLAGRSGKLNRFDELIVDLLDVGERALVFTQFREMGDLLQTHLNERFSIAAPFLHGGVTKNRRDRMVAEFQAGDGPPLLLVSLKAGGTGLNLTAASQIIHYDRWWNPAVEDQATDRAWRIGQLNTVNVHKLVCQGTIEERIGEVIDEKRKIANAVIGSGEAWLSELTTDELAAFVRLDRGSS